MKKAAGEKKHLQGTAVQEERGPRKPKLKQQQPQPPVTICSSPSAPGSNPGASTLAPPPSSLPLPPPPPPPDPPLFPGFSHRSCKLPFPFPSPLPDLTPVLTRHLGFSDTKSFSLASLLATTSPYFIPTSAVPPPLPPPLLPFPPHPPSTPLLASPFLPHFLPPPHLPHRLHHHTSAFTAVRPVPQDWTNNGVVKDDDVVQLLGCIVRQARVSPYLSPLPSYDLLLLLTRAWPHLLLLHAASSSPLHPLLLHPKGEAKLDLEGHGGSGGGGSVKCDGEEGLREVTGALRMCRQYSLDPTELSLLSAVILLRSQPGLSSEGQVLITALQERAQAALQAHSAASRPRDPLRPSNLLLLVASLHRLPRPALIAALAPALANAPPHTPPLIIAALLAAP